MMVATAQNVLQRLHGLERVGQNQYKAFNPYNPPGQSRNKNLLVDISDDEHGNFTLFSATGGEKRSGSLYELAEIVGVDVQRKDKETADTRHTVYRDLAHYAQAHGAPASAYEAAGWKQVEYQGRPALEYKTTTGRRWRFLDGQTPRFKHMGYNSQPYVSCWYGMKHAPALLESSGLPLILCNGEPSVVAAQHWGLPAVCVTSGEKAIPVVLIDKMKETYPSGKIIIAMDCDQKGRAVAAAVTRQLAGAGYEAMPVDLGLGLRGDLADYCLLHGAKAKESILTLGTLAMPEPAADPLPESKPAPAMPSLEERTIAQMGLLNDTLAQIKSAVRRDASVHAPEARQALLATARAVIEQLEQSDGVDLMVSGEAVADGMLADYMAAKKRNGALAGMPTGFSALDRIIDGFMPGLNVLIGATGMGKSWMAASIATFLAKNGYHGTIVTSEMNPKAWMRRCTAYMAGVNSQQIKRGVLTVAEEARIAEAANYLEQYLSFVKGVRPTAASLRATVLNSKMAGRADFVVIDSASRLVEPGDNMYGETARVQNALQELYLETDLPFIVTGQVKGREIGNRSMKMPTINDSFGGSAWEHNADVLIGLYNHTYYVDQKMADPDPMFPAGTFAMRVLKIRDGQSAADKILKMKFVDGRGLFEMDEQHTPPERYSAPRYKDADHV